ncbi:unnamed protein product, partial [Prorocentrum cordatum]
MPPRPKGKAKAKPAAVAPPNLNSNTPIYSDFETKLAKIKGHPLLANIEDESVLTIPQGGRMVPFDAQNYKTCMEQNSEYQCAGNFFWQNVMVSPTPSVTILKKNIRDVGNMNYPDPSQPVRFIPHTINIGIPSVDFDPTAHMGSLSRISPCEYVLAAIDRCSMAIDAEADDATILSWKASFRSCHFIFKARDCLAQAGMGQGWPWRWFGSAPKLIDIENIRFESMNLREKAIGDAATVTWTALQKVQIVMNEAARMQHPSAKKVAAQFEKRVNFAPSSEKFAEGFVDAAMTINNRMLSIPACRVLLTKLDNDMGTNGPLNSVYKLQAIVSKGRTSAAIENITTYLVFGFECGHYEIEDLSVSKLRNGQVELMILKRSMLSYFMDVSFHELGFPPDDVSLIRRSYQDTDAVKAWAKAPTNERQPDLFWKASLCKPSNLFSEFIESMVYDVKYDANLKHALKYSKTPQNILSDYQGIKETYNDILTELEKFNAQRAVSGSDPRGRVADAPEEAEPETLDTKERLGKQLGEVKDAIDAAVAEDANHWRAVAHKTVSQQVKLVVHSQPDTMQQYVKECSISQTKGDLDGLVAYHFDSKLAGEAITNPQVRTCPLQEKPYCLLVQTVLAGRAPPTEKEPGLNPGEIALLIDGGKSGNKRPLLKPWRPVAGDEDEDADMDDEAAPTAAFKTRQVNLIKNEASVRARRVRAVARGAGSIPQLEAMHICGTDMSLPEQSWGEGFEGTNKGTAIAPIVVDAIENDWTETVKMKREIYGNFRVAVGNTDPGQPDKRDTDKEPVCFGTLPIKFYTAILTGYMIKTVIDLTVGTGAFAQACLLKRCGHAKVSYFGICLSEAHMNAVRERLVYFVLNQMMTEGSPLYIAKCAEALMPTTPKKGEKPAGSSKDSPPKGGGGASAAGSKDTTKSGKRKGDTGDSKDSKSTKKSKKGKKT